MAKYRFSYEDEFGHEVVKAFDTEDTGETWNDILPYFKEFLSGVGFIIYGDLDAPDHERITYQMRQAEEKPCEGKCEECDCSFGVDIEDPGYNYGQNHF